MFLNPFTFCLATATNAVPSGPDWIHEVKADGYRARLEIEDGRVRLMTRGGHNWTERYPLVVEAAKKNRRKRLSIDGELVVLDENGIPDFNALHSRKHDREAQLYAFDLLALNGEDLRRLPLFERKQELARVLKSPAPGIYLAPYESGAIGPDLFRHACLLGLEGIVSKHREMSYRSGRCTHWRKAKNRQHASFARIADRF